VILGEDDVLRDRGEAYARKLTEAGVRTASVRFSGTHKDFLCHGVHLTAEPQPRRQSLPEQDPASVNSVSAASLLQGASPRVALSWAWLPDAARGPRQLP
jgi:acetyl esterase/lipase